MKILIIASTELRRFLRDRSNIFFVFMFPMLLVLLFGLMFGGGITTRVGVVGDAGQLTSDVVTGFEEAGFAVDEFDSEKGGLGQVERGLITSLVVFDADDELRVVSQEGHGFEIASVVNSAVAQYTVQRQAEVFINDQLGSGGEAAVAAVRALVPPVEVTTTLAVGAKSNNPFPDDYEEPATQFDFGAPQQLVLFTFLTSLASSGALILTKKLGVARRMISTPTSVTSVLLGEALGRYFIALLQAMFIVLGTALLFGVHWGDPLAVGLLVALFSLVGTAVGMLLGSALNNDQQAGGIGVMASLSLAALGGAMVPIEIFSDTMKKVAHFTPHAWALDGFREIQFRSGGVSDILTELGVLAAAAAVLLGIAIFAFRRRITT
jgi:ABC-2 type transport system permease protein